MVTKKINKSEISATLPNNQSDVIVLQWVKTNNLKNIDLVLPKNQIITFTWVSGSGKSSLAFETIYKEWQYRYIESLSSYLRQFFNLWERPDIDYCAWLSPAIAIEQNKRWWNSRSTVGTLTELDDYVRLLLQTYNDYKCMWEFDNNWNGFEWMNCDDKDRSTYSFIRRSSDSKKSLVFIINLTPMRWENYKVGISTSKKLKLIRLKMTFLYFIQIIRFYQ